MGAGRRRQAARQMEEGKHTKRLIAIATKEETIQMHMRLERVVAFVEAR